jgi:hypothetical protein
MVTGFLPAALAGRPAPDTSAPPAAQAESFSISRRLMVRVCIFIVFSLVAEPPAAPTPASEILGAPVPPCEAI